MPYELKIHPQLSEQGELKFEVSVRGRQPVREIRFTVPDLARSFDVVSIRKAQPNIPIQIEHHAAAGTGEIYVRLWTEPSGSIGPGNLLAFKLQQNGAEAIGKAVAVKLEGVEIIGAKEEVLPSTEIETKETTIQFASAPDAAGNAGPTDLAQLKGVTYSLAVALRQYTDCVRCSAAAKQSILSELALQFPKQRDFLERIPIYSAMLCSLSSTFRDMFHVGYAAFKPDSSAFLTLAQLIKFAPEALGERAAELSEILRAIRQITRPGYLERFHPCDFLPNPGLVISNIAFANFANKSPNVSQEFVTLRNASLRPIPLRGWKLAVQSGEARPAHYFSFAQDDLLLPGRSLRIYSGRGVLQPGLYFAGHDHPQFSAASTAIILKTPKSFATATAIWLPGALFARYSQQQSSWGRQLFQLPKDGNRPSPAEILEQPWEKLSWPAAVRQPGQATRPPLSDFIPLESAEWRRLFPSGYDGLILWGPAGLGKVGYPGEISDYGFPASPGSPASDELPPPLALPTGLYWAEPLPPTATDEDGYHEPDCAAWLDGPECVCIHDNVSYTAEGTCDGECENWAISNATVARIVRPDECTVRVLILKEGVFNISCNYVTDYHEIIELSQEVHAYGTTHVQGDTINSIVITAPLVQPHPTVRIAKPVETDDDECLGQTSNFVVHRNKLDKGWNRYLNQEISLKEVARDYLEIELKAKGTLSDFFQEISSLSWKLSDGTGADLIKNEEFTDSSFETKIPGENAMNPRVILLKGLGEFILKLIAENPIQRRGTDWVTLQVAMDPDALKQVAQLQRHLGELLAMNPPPSQLAAHQARILNTTIAIQDSQYAALLNPCIEVKHSYHETQTFQLEPACKTRTQGKDGDGDVDPRFCTVISEATGFDLHTLSMRQEAPDIYLNNDPVKNYWVTKESYSGHVYNWPRDGLLRGDRNGTLTSLFECCDETIPVFGVEIVADDCVVLKKNETISLRGDGQPAVVDGLPGMYRWSVIAKPDEDAEANISPDDWTTSPKATLTVDQSGIYTVKVEYQLGGRICSLTYALADIRVIQKVTERVQWSVHRVGTYTGDLAKHVGRPYYQQRKGGRIRAAEMLITPDPSADTSIIGKLFSGSFVTLEELAFNDDLIIRAYFRDYSPNLTADDYHDYNGAPYVMVNPEAPYEAVVDISSRKDIHAIHLLNIQYKQVMRLKGQAVPISFVFNPPAVLQCPRTFVVPLPTGVYYAEPEVSTPPPRLDLPPLVNLLVYNRDLGLAHPSNGVTQLSNTGDSHNLPNGNLFQEITLLETDGHGENTRLTLTYNSLQASYQDSLEFFQDLNGISDADLYNSYCQNPIGKGWTHSYNVYLRDYVRAVDIDGRVLERFVELACPDGNRIQFKLSDESGLPPNVSLYVPEFRSEHWMGSAELGHSLRLYKGQDVLGQDEYTLEMLYGRKYKFDAQRRLVEITDRLIQGSALLRPLKIRYSGRAVEVEDSRSRLTLIGALPDGRSQSGTVRISDSADNVTTLTYNLKRVRQLDRASLQSWLFDYHPLVGQRGAGAVCSLLKSITDPKGVQSQYEYYEGEEFQGVPKKVAADFWGRLGQASKSAERDRREHLWRYKAYDASKQQVVYRNPENVEFAVTYYWKELAVASIFYIKQRKDDKTGALTGQPTYDPVAGEPSGSPPLTRVAVYTYHNDTKLPATVTDLYSNVTGMSYKGIRGDSAFLLEKLTKPDRTVLEYEYYADNLVYRAYNPRPETQPKDQTSFTKYVYDSKGALTNKKYPSIGMPQLVEEVWEIHPGYGRVEKYHDRKNVVWTYGYGDSVRDPYNTGLHTSRSITKQIDATHTQVLEWQLSYDKLGRTEKTYEPLYGEVKIFEYHQLGPVKKVRLQPIEVATGGTAGAEIQLLHDSLLRLETRTTTTGQDEWRYNHHGETVLHIDAARVTTENDYHKTGVVKSFKDGGGHLTSYVIDELSRNTRIKYPQPDAREKERQSPAFADVFDYDDRSAVVFERRYQLDPWTLKREITRTFQHGRLAEQTVSHKPKGKETKVSYTHDDWGKEKTVTIRDGSDIRRTVTKPRDAWGREGVTIESYHDGTASSSRRYEMGLDVIGDVVTQIPPKVHTTVPSVDVKTTFERNELGRIRSIKDSFGIVIRKYEYRDFGNYTEDPQELSRRSSRVLEYGQDPSLREDGNSLVVLKETHFNRRGLPTDTFYGASGTTNWVSKKRYDPAGRVVEETDELGITRHYDLDGLDRVTTIAVEWKAKKEGIPWESFDKANPAHTRTEGQYLRYDYTYNGQIGIVHEVDGLEQHAYDSVGRRILTIQKDGRTEELTYDVTDRVTRRTAPSQTDHTYKYDDEKRTVEVEYRNAASQTKTISAYDWEGKLLDFRCLTNYLSGAFAIYKPSANDIYLRYEYGKFGKLTSKEYRSFVDPVRPGPLIGAVHYDYNDADLRISTEVVIQSSPAFRHKDKYNYDPNLRLVEIDAGGYERYFFDYNRAGFLKKLCRPMPAYTAGSKPKRANTTSYTHDQKARLVAIVERAGLHEADKRIAEFKFFYDVRRPKEAWDPQHPGVPWEPSTAWDMEKLDFLPTNSPALKGLIYERFLDPNPAPGQRNIFAQDFAYARNGGLFASATRFRANHGNVYLPWFYAESRINEWNEERTAITSKTNYRFFDSRGNPFQDVRFGEINITYQDRSQSALGWSATVLEKERTRLPVAPVFFPMNFLEDNKYNGNKELTQSYLVQEDPSASTDREAFTADEQIYKRYYHDAVGSLASIVHRSEKREASSNFEADLNTATDPAKQSMENATRHQYGPNGEEVFRTASYWIKKSDGVGQRMDEQTLIVSDGPALVAEYGLTTGAGRFFQIIPGLNNRLSGRSIAAGAPVYYYRSDHKGATTFLTDESGALAFDFQYRSADGHAELFGGVIEPNDKNGRRVEKNIDIFSYYQPSGPRLDLALGQLAEIEDRGEKIQSRASLFAAPVGGRNNYGFTDGHPYLYLNKNDTVGRLANPTWWEIALQAYIDYVHGFGDAVSFGLSKYAREYFWGVRGQTIYSSTYIAGGIAGTLYSIALGVGGFEAAGWAGRFIGAYLLTGDIVAVAQSSYHAATGQFTWLDALGFLPTIAWSLRAAYAIRMRLTSRSIVGMAQAPRVNWNPSPTVGAQPVTNVEAAIERARGLGVKVPREVVFFVEEDEAFADLLRRARIPEEGIGETLATYSRIGRTDVERFMWQDFLNRFGRLPVTVRESLLTSEEAIVAVIAHELFEINALQGFLSKRGPTGFITAEFLQEMTRQGVRRNWHDKAWDFSDKIVEKMRRQ